MQHRASRRHRKLGWPEVWLVCVAAVAIAPATLWWQSRHQPNWKRTAGQAISSKLTRMHYNAQDYRTKVQLDYRYTVGMAQYTGNYDGFWPEVGGPNALPPLELEALKTPNKELIIFYDPVNPQRSTLHPGNGDTSPLWLVLIAAGICIASAYTFYIYPAWRA